MLKPSERNEIREWLQQVLANPQLAKIRAPLTVFVVSPTVTPRAPEVDEQLADFIQVVTGLRDPRLEVQVVDEATDYLDIRGRTCCAVIGWAGWRAITAHKRSALRTTLLTVSRAIRDRKADDMIFKFGATA